MARRPRHAPLAVFLNNLPVGELRKDTGGAISFRYDDGWLSRENAIPVSLSLPLREDAYRGEPVAAVFENLLPDSDAIRGQVAERVGAAGADAYSLLSAIGHDCVGALRFVRDPEAVDADSMSVTGDPVDDAEIERILLNLGHAPLGLARDDSFRISIAGTQEKTALTLAKDGWLKPHGHSPTTHILKPQIGKLPNGLDLSASVENEFFCLKLLEAFGLEVAQTSMRRFGETKALVVERFDRRWTVDGRLLRVPQEDCCQALSFPPTRKYQSDGGPRMMDVLDLLKGSDEPARDQSTFLMAQILFWLIGATDGHAKNFSIHLRPGGSFSLTPIYDVLSAQPEFDTGRVQPEQFRLAMSVGENKHYRIDEIRPRHWMQTVKQAKLSKRMVTAVIERVSGIANEAVGRVEKSLPSDFPEQIHASVVGGLRTRLRYLVSEA